MSFDRAVQAFVERHSLDLSRLPEEQLVAIQCAAACHDAVNNDFARLPASVLDHDSAVGLLWQLYERCTERVFGALVALATACPAASEIVARAARAGAPGAKIQRTSASGDYVNFAALSFLPTAS